MEDLNLDPTHIISDVDELRALFPPTHDLAIQKTLTRLDKHAREFIERAPFLCLGTQDAEGKADVSPRGDPCGFVQILDDQTLAIPDRPGNNRLDSLANIVTNPSVGLLFIVPGFDETLRVNGKARLTTDPGILNRMKVHERAPKLAIIVRIDTLFLHCAKAFRRSKLWDPETFQDRKEMPSLINLILDQTTGAPDDPDEVRKLDDQIEESYNRSMY